MTDLSTRKTSGNSRSALVWLWLWRRPGVLVLLLHGLWGLECPAPCDRCIGQYRAMWPSCPHEWQFTPALERVGPGFFGIARGAFLAWAYSSAHCPASAQVVGLCSLTHTRTSSGKTDNNCSIPIFSNAFERVLHSDNHFLPRSIMSVARLTYDSSDFRVLARSFRWYDSSVTSYLLRMDFLIAT